MTCNILLGAPGELKEAPCLRELLVRTYKRWVPLDRFDRLVARLAELGEWDRILRIQSYENLIEKLVDLQLVKHPEPYHTGPAAYRFVSADRIEFHPLRRIRRGVRLSPEAEEVALLSGVMDATRTQFYSDEPVTL